MKTRSNQSTGIRTAMRGLIALSLAFGANRLEAAFSQAEVTKAVNEVKLLPEGRSAIPAKAGSVVTGSTAVQTGIRSRAELQFPDETVVRLGSNSVFSFDSDERDLEVGQGSILVRAPKGGGRMGIKSSAVTAAITGTTILFEYSPSVHGANGNEIKAGIIKIIVMEGSLEWALNSNPRKKLKMRAGDMVAFPPDARKLPRKVKIDLNRIKTTSLLMDGGMGTLPDTALVDREIALQQKVSNDANDPAEGFPLKKPKPENKRSEVSVASRSRPITRILERIFTPPTEVVVVPTPATAVPEIVVIPTRPDRCPQDSLDSLCRQPGGATGN